MKFLADRNLGKLVKWLRVLGYDTVSYTNELNRGFLDYGFRENRVVLSRRRDLVERNFMGTLLIIHTDKIEDQIQEVIQKLNLKPDTSSFLTRCLKCNERLVAVTKESVRDIVPPYVFMTQDNFYMCTSCGSIYWAGTHRDNIFKTLKMHNLTDHP
ncbi:MAG: Mut7-C RNAse domain-containing protein [Syntrophales bacterium]|jgi:uncharacterized protein with PIN domain|nr:Mut7-C RNAse domain-containing protein [Syntrophales bacterium]MDY0043526.1 Mut7-C RNAse domain-containing protein [Syntrophales bacterium]